jgi:hypothetical protein
MLTLFLFHKKYLPFDQPFVKTLVLRELCLALAKLFFFEFRRIQSPQTNYMKKRTSLPFASALVALAGSASAAITITGSGNSSGFTVSSTDLLQTQGSISNDSLTINVGENGHTGSGYGNDVGTVSNLTDGLFQTLNNDGTTSNGARKSYAISGGSITYSLDTTVNTMGYDISSIGIFTGWQNGGRDGINVEVFYATVADPSTFVSLGTATQNGSGQYQTNEFSESVSPNVLAAGVKSIRFSFGSQENGGTGYKELDVIGVAAVPEPSAALLGGLGALALLRRRRA